MILAFYSAQRTHSDAQTCVHSVRRACFPSTSPRSTRTSRPSTALPPTPPSSTQGPEGLSWTWSPPYKHAKHIEYTSVRNPITIRPSRRSIRFCAEFQPQRPTGDENGSHTGANTPCTGETQSVHMREFACFGVLKRCQRCAEACFGVFRCVQRVCLRRLRVCTRPKVYEVGA